MNLQFADLNADGHDDIITATFEGTSFILYGSDEGWQEPEHLKDSQGRNLVLSLYYDFDEDQYDNAERSPPGEQHEEDHCVSTTAMDWDNDGDLDLLLGAKEGRLYLRKNIGSKKKPVFADENLLLQAVDKELMIPGGLTAAQPFDWDLDGDLDLICGSFQGGVYFVENTAKRGKPVALAKPRKMLDGNIDLGGEEPYASKDWYATPLDYDKDGKLDLLVGMQVNKPKKKKKLSDEEKEELAAAKKKMEELQQTMSKKYEEIQKELEDLPAEEQMEAMEKKWAENKELVELEEKLTKAFETINQLQPYQRPEAGVYLLRGM